MSISRRGALLGATAAVAVAGVPLAVQASDTVLLARIEQFHDVYGELQDVWAKHLAHRAAVKARPDCPPLGESFEGNKAHHDYMDAHDGSRYWDPANRLNEQSGALANAIFETPARTAKGALEKLKIAYMAVGDGESTVTGDRDLLVFQDLAAPWMEAVIADFERLVGEVRP